MKNKNGGVSLLKAIIIGLIILAVVVGFSTGTINGLFKSVIKIFSPYEKPELDQTNVFGILATGITVEGCTNARCDISKSAKVYVTVKNTGSKTRVVYANPVIAYGCDGDGPEWWNCKNGGEFTQSTVGCVVAPAETVQCEAGDIKLLTEKARKEITQKTFVYLIPGVICPRFDQGSCYNPTSAEDTQNYNLHTYKIFEQGNSGWVDSGMIDATR